VNNTNNINNTNNYVNNTKLIKLKLKKIFNYTREKDFNYTAQITFICACCIDVVVYRDVLMFRKSYVIANHMCVNRVQSKT